MEELINRPLGWTTVKESKLLLDAGLDPNTADMCWGFDAETMVYKKSPYPLPWRGYTAKAFYLPCWSLGALLELLPTDKESSDDRYVNISRRMKSKYYPESWHLYFIGPVDHKLHFVDEAVFIEGVVKMMVLCIGHGLVKKGGE